MATGGRQMKGFAPAKISDSGPFAIKRMGRPEGSIKHSVINKLFSWLLAQDCKLLSPIGRANIVAVLRKQDGDIGLPQRQKLIENGHEIQKEGCDCDGWGKGHRS